MRQTETAALKRAGANKSAVFTRQLAAVYTRTTMIGEDVDVLQDGSDVAGAHTTPCMVCIADAAAPGDEHRAVISLVAVAPATGDVVYDEFMDDVNRSELETRLAHIQPAELLLPTELQPRTEQLLRRYAHGDSAVRTERMVSERFDSVTAVATIAATYGVDATALPRAIIGLPRGVQTCLAALVDHLSEFGLQHVVRLTSNLQPFCAQGHELALNAVTVRNLELFQNLVDGTRRGSLLGILDHTRTPFGSRLLRHWLSHPLADAAAIAARLDAVATLRAQGDEILGSVPEAMRVMTDVERTLASAFYGKCCPSQFIVMVESLDSARSAFLRAVDSVTRRASGSSLLVRVVTTIPDGLDAATQLRTQLDSQAAHAKDKANIFRTAAEPAEMTRCKSAIRAIHTELQGHRKELRQELGNPSLEYVTVSGTEYLVEVRNTAVARLPADWIKMSATKVVSRFHTPKVARLLEQRSQLEEELQAHARIAWSMFLREFGRHYDDLRRAVHSMAEVDCLLSLAAVARLPHYVRPTLRADASHIVIEAGRHAVVEALLTDRQFVPNDTRLEVSRVREPCPARQCLCSHPVKLTFLASSPQMAGHGRACHDHYRPQHGRQKLLHETGRASPLHRSCELYLGRGKRGDWASCVGLTRMPGPLQVALICIMAQLGSFVPAAKADLGILDAVFTRCVTPCRPHACWFVTEGVCVAFSSFGTKNHVHLSSGHFGVGSDSLS